MSQIDAYDIALARMRRLTASLEAAYSGSPAALRWMEMEDRREFASNLRAVADIIDQTKKVQTV